MQLKDAMMGQLGTGNIGTGNNSTLVTLNRHRMSARTNRRGRHTFADSHGSWRAGHA